MATVRRLIAFKNDGGLITTALQMAIKTVGGGVQRAVLKPLDAQIAGIVGDVFNFRIRFDPVYSLAMLGPESFVIVDRGSVKLLIGVVIRMRMAGDYIAWWKSNFFGHGSPLNSGSAHFK